MTNEQISLPFDVTFINHFVLVYRVAEYEAKNKMGVSNLVSLFGPTMMTVDGDPVSQLLSLDTGRTLFITLHFILSQTDNICQHQV